MVACSQVYIFREKKEKEIKTYEECYKQTTLLSCLSLEEFFNFALVVSVATK